MKLAITDDAVSWFKNEMSIKTGESVRIYARYGGCGNVQAGFSLGIAKEAPQEIGVSNVANGILFFMEKDDLWYLNEADLTVQYNSRLAEIEFVVQ